MVTISITIFCIAFVMIRSDIKNRFKAKKYLEFSKCLRCANVRNVQPRRVNVQLVSVLLVVGPANVKVRYSVAMCYAWQWCRTMYT